MPTRGRAAWAQQALKCFLGQTYPEKQLIILDDLEDPSFDNHVRYKRANVRYLAGPGHLGIPQKRNAACELSDSDIMMHFDSDDWSDPGRMAAQVHLLEESQKQVAGFHSLLFYVEPSGQAFKYVNDASYALGTSLCYRKSWWELHRFNENLKDGEDNQFVNEARKAGELISVDAGQLMVARIHDSNTSPKVLDGCQTSYLPISREALPAGFFQ